MHSFTVPLGSPDKNKKDYAVVKYNTGFVIDDGVCTLFTPQNGAAWRILVQILLSSNSPREKIGHQSHFPAFSATILQHC
ncbi:hypothetical protein GJV07_15170 [Enterobacteriaceae bacterium RIT711]|nr:hypothetical protein [Enterobacteriaceae bacterium RIT711]